MKGEWKAVNVDPSLFSDPGLEGLVCFEELTDYSLVEPEKTIHAEESVKKTRKDRKRKHSDEQPNSEDTEAKRKNKKRKKQLMTDEASVDDEEISRVDQTPQTTSTLTKEEKKKKRKKKALSEECELKKSDGVDAGTVPSKSRKKNWSNAALADAESGNADVSAWKDLFVPDAVLKALSKLGFSAPTPIQALAIPPAIRDHLDVLGAAETGEKEITRHSSHLIDSLLLLFYM